jgi:hypothetical protein
MLTYEKQKTKKEDSISVLLKSNFIQIILAKLIQ